jgi:hypothetical protein
VHVRYWRNEANFARNPHPELQYGSTAQITEGVDFVMSKDSVRTASGSAPECCRAEDRDASCLPSRDGWLETVSAALGRTALLTRVLLVLAVSGLLWTSAVSGVLAMLG